MSVWWVRMKATPPRPSPLEQLAKVYSPSIFAFKPVYLTARGRRTLLFFPDEYRYGCSVRGERGVELSVDHVRYISRSDRLTLACSCCVGFTLLGCSPIEQFAMMEKLAVEFRHDPLTFCWLDLDALPPQQAKRWQSQLKASANRTCFSQ